MIKIAIVFTCYNRKIKTEHCMNTIKAQLQKLSNRVKTNIFCCDDNSTDGTYEMLTSKFKEITVVRGTGKLFWAKGMAMAMTEAEKAEPDFYLMINDDVEFFDNAIETMLISYEHVHNGMEPIVGSTKDILTGERTYGGIHWNHKTYGEIQTPVYPSIPCARCEQANWNCFLLPREVYKKVGPIDDFYEHSFADYDYSNRICKAGYSIYVAEDYIGYCSRNSINGTWMDTSLSIKKRIKALHKPSGIPPKSNWHYCKKFYGIGCLHRFLSPYRGILFSALKKSFGR